MIYFERDRQTGKIHLVSEIVNGGPDWLMILAVTISVGVGFIGGIVFSMAFLGVPIE